MGLFSRKNNFGKLNVRASVDTHYNGLVSTKRLFKEYAEEIDWVVVAGNHETKEELDDGSTITWVNVDMQPEGGTLSMKEYCENAERIRGLCAGLFIDSLYDGDKEEGMKNYNQTISYTRYNTTIEDSGESNVSWIWTFKIGILQISGNIQDRIQFEKEYPELSLELTGRTSEEDARSIFTKTEDIEDQSDLKEDLEKTFGWNL